MKTDAEIQKEVMDDLKWEPILNATEIGVAVRQGVVTLSGQVSTYSKKMVAQQASGFSLMGTLPKPIGSSSSPNFQI
jgi:osmotically-inducible protein OsmY